MGGKAEPAKVAWADGWTQTRAFSKGRFVVLGFAGTEGADHMSHLRQISKLWKRYLAIPADLFRDDFSRFPPGWLTRPIGQLNGAIQEYHYLPHRGVPLGPWANAICHLDAWAVGDEEGTPYLEQHTVNAQAALMNPLFITGDPEWGDYTVEVEVRPLSLDDMAGVVFRYHTNRHYYLFALTGGKTARLAVRLPLEKTFRVAEWRELGSVAFPYDTTHYYRLTVENAGPDHQGLYRRQARPDGRRRRARPRQGGRHRQHPGAVPGLPRHARRMRSRRRIDDRIARREAELARLRAENPRPKLWKPFDTPRFGAGRNARFGDLDGDGVPEMLIAQNIPRIGDNFIQISCLTAVTFDGKVLWQLGRPDPRNGLLTADTPFQIHDIDGDGRNEVVMVKDFQLQVREGSTGRLRQSVAMPPALPDNRLKPYTLTNGDSHRLPGPLGTGQAPRDPGQGPLHELLGLQQPPGAALAGTGPDRPLSRTRSTSTATAARSSRSATRSGTTPAASSGARTTSCTTTPTASRSATSAPTRRPSRASMPGAATRASSSSTAAARSSSTCGSATPRAPASASSAPTCPGLQLMCVNFWKNPGIVTLFDADGNMLAQEEPIHSGSPMLPVNWRGDGQEFVLLSGNAREGGMIDGQLRRVVMFPDDGHPDLAAYVANVTGDARDEVILWDQERVWIYTQDRPFAGKRLYAPIRNPDCNESNYRTVVSRPRWIEPEREEADATRSVEPTANSLSEFTGLAKACRLVMANRRCLPLDRSPRRARADRSRPPGRDRRPAAEGSSRPGDGGAG